MKISRKLLLATLTVVATVAALSWVVANTVARPRIHNTQVQMRSGPVSNDATLPANPGTTPPTTGTSTPTPQADATAQAQDAFMNWLAAHPEIAAQSRRELGLQGWGALGVAVPRNANVAAIKAEAERRGVVIEVLNLHASPQSALVAQAVSQHPAITSAGSTVPGLAAQMDPAAAAHGAPITFGDGWMYDVQVRGDGIDYAQLSKVLSETVRLNIRLAPATVGLAVGTATRP